MPKGRMSWIGVAVSRVWGGRQPTATQICFSHSSLSTLKQGAALEDD